MNAAYPRLVEHLAALNEYREAIAQQAATAMTDALKASAKGEDPRPHLREARSAMQVMAGLIQVQLEALDKEGGVA